MYMYMYGSRLHDSVGSRRVRSCVKLGGGPFCCLAGCAHSASWGRSELAMAWAWWAVAVLAVAHVWYI